MGKSLLLIGIIRLIFIFLLITITRLKAAWNCTITEARCPLTSAAVNDCDMFRGSWTTIVTLTLTSSHR